MIMIEQVTKDPVTDLCLDVIKIKKQAIVFLSTKKSAEACAEKIATKLQYDETTKKMSELAEKALANPTKQCKRLGKTLQKRIAFHHSGLNTKQRKIIEESFRAGEIKIICSTTTLGAGLDLPAYRSIIRDIKRFSPGWGSIPIPVLEYEQMAGRAGRPKYDEIGEAICIATTPEEKEYIWNEYINGTVENIQSKLAVEPVLRTYTLSLVSSGYTNTFNTLIDFLKQTFYAHQYKDLKKLEQLIHKVIEDLEEWNFVKTTRNKNNLFESALKIRENYKIETTQLGKRVSELYLDPLTANELITNMMQAKDKKTPFSILQMICSTNEIRPLFTPKKKEQEIIENKIIKESNDLLIDEPSSFSDNYYEFLSTIKTAIVLEDWMNEKTEDLIYEDYGVTPGELNSKLERANWILYSAQELAKIKPEIKRKHLDLPVIRERLTKGIKEELLQLAKLKGIGRIRARKLYQNKIKNVKDIKQTSLETLRELIGDAVALDIKKQVGQDLRTEKITTKKNKRKGQISLEDYQEE